MKVGIIGQGFVGNAVYQSFKEAFDVLTYDLDHDKCNSALDDVLSCRVIFLCLPTPMALNGACYTNILEDVLDTIPTNRIVVIKSTIPPRVVREFNSKYFKFEIVYNPEFLTAINAVDDFRNQDRIILGCNTTAMYEVGKLYQTLFTCPIYYTDGVSAMMCKYIVNTFLSMKVSYANEIFNFCEQRGVDYNKAVELAKLDKRLGDSHWQVPGPDGYFGFGGTCFPKDVNALISEFKDIDATMLKATWDKNLKVRGNQP